MKYASRTASSDRFAPKTAEDCQTKRTDASAETKDRGLRSIRASGNNSKSSTCDLALRGVHRAFAAERSINMPASGPNNLNFSPAADELHDFVAVAGLDVGLLPFRARENLKIALNGDAAGI